MSGSGENSRYWRWAVVLALLLTVVVADRLVGSASPVQQRAGPETVVSLTFNDGLASQYRHARPILKSYGLQGTFFVASNFVTSGDRRYMNAAQLDRLYGTETRSEAWAATTRVCERSTAKSPKPIGRTSGRRSAMTGSGSTRVATRQ